MPPIVRFTREAVLTAAFELVRREGQAALNARAVAKELGGSTQPIFRLFSGMDELRAEIISLTDERIRQQLRTQATSSRNPYISVLLSYIHFAHNEPELFKLLFMRDRVSDGSCSSEYRHDWGFPVIEANFNVDRETAIQLYERTFFYAHGIAVCIATKFMPLQSEECLEALLVDNLEAAARQLGIALPDQ